ncbi:MAG TPA: glycosyltransferase family 9 protein [Terriglobia bacterium]|nr:glycosyltransferase family 9 protein [Terriglobia bacterium]
MKVLAIRLGRFGDLILLFRALVVLKARLPESHLTLLTDLRWVPLAEMCPAIDEIIPLDRLAMRDGSLRRAIGGIVSLMSVLRRRRFDAVIDFHGFRETSLLAWWTGAPQRWGLKRFDQSFLAFCFNRPPVIEDKALHASESFLRLVASFAPASSPTNAVAPLIVPSDALRWAEGSVPDSPFAVLFVDAPVPERIWPLDRFIAVAKYFVKEYGCAAVLIGSKASESRDLPDRVRALSDLSIPQLAALIDRARILVSNDTGPMHLGPALGTPTVAIFSVGIPTHFRPTGASDRYVEGSPIETVETDEVIAAITQVWESSDRRDLRR